MGEAAMATGPGGDLEAAGRGRLRASHADREHVIGILKAAFVQGRLTKDELDARTGQTFAARTYAELATLTVDLPAGLADDVPPARAAQAQARQPMSNAARAGTWAVVAVGVPVVLVSLTGSAQLFLLLTPFYFMALAFLSAEMAASRIKSRSQRGQLPPRPASSGGGQAAKNPLSAGPSGQLPPAGDGPRHAAEAQRRRLPRPPLPRSRSLRRWRRAGCPPQRPAISGQGLIA
jgi:Domain of unknown function (DUF1707)